MEIKEKQTIDIQRCRFAHFQPQAIEYMTISSDKSLLALSRENNSIEFWTLPSTFTQLLVLPGNKNCDIRNIAFLELNALPFQDRGQDNKSVNPLFYQNQKKEFKKRRLLTSGLNGLLIEWDLLNRKPASKFNANSAIWDMNFNQKFSYLACEDGTIKIVKIKKENIDFIKNFPKVDARCLSLDISLNNENVEFILVGYSDSSMRKWEMKSGNSIVQWSKQNKKKDCMIWKIKIFKQFVISGDSQGDLCVWDFQHGTLIKNFNQLKGDILALEVNEKFDSVYASGVDSRVLSIQQKEDGQWVHTSLFRGQSHDIKSLLLLNSKQLLSGGVTTDICVYSLDKGRLGDQYGKNSKQQQQMPKLRHVPPFPFKSPTKFNNDLVLVVNGNNRHLEIYSIACQQLILRIEKKGESNLLSYDFKDKYIVYSDINETQIFTFDANELSLLKLTSKICHQNGLKSLPPAQWIQIYKDENSQDYFAFLLDYNLTLHEVNLTQLSLKETINLESLLIDYKLKSYDKIVNFVSYNQITHQLLISLLRTNIIFIFDIKTQQIQWFLPQSDSALPICCHGDQDKLIIVYDNNKFCLFDTINNSIHYWNKANVDKFPKNYLSRYNRIIGVTQITHNKYLLYTHYTYITLDIGMDLPQESLIIQDHPGKRIDEKSLTSHSWFDNLKLSQQKYLSKNQNLMEDQRYEDIQNLTISNKLKGILNMTYDKESQKLRVFENVWKKSVEAFPGTLEIPKFGK